MSPETTARRVLEHQGLTADLDLIAQRGDEVHPVSSAERLAQHLPNARLEVFDEHELLWGHRARVREVVGEFFDPPADDIR